MTGITDAAHAEYGETGTPVVSLLACSLDGVEITVKLAAGSQLQRLYGCDEAGEKTTCNYGLNPANGDIASSNGMRIAATDETGEVRAIERTDHPFFLGTLYQPQLRSSAERPHPVFLGLVEAMGG